MAAAIAAGGGGHLERVVRLPQLPLELVVGHCALRTALAIAAASRALRALVNNSIEVWPLQFARVCAPAAVTALRPLHGRMSLRTSFVLHYCCRFAELPRNIGGTLHRSAVRHVVHSGARTFALASPAHGVSACGDGHTVRAVCAALATSRGAMRQVYVRIDLAADGEAAACSVSRGAVGVGVCDAARADSSLHVAACARDAARPAGSSCHAMRASLGAFVDDAGVWYRAHGDGASFSVASAVVERHAGRKIGMARHDGERLGVFTLQLVVDWRSDDGTVRVRVVRGHIVDFDVRFAPDTDTLTPTITLRGCGARVTPSLYAPPPPPPPPPPQPPPPPPQPQPLPPQRP